MLYAIRVIRSFQHKGLKIFFETGSKAGIQAKHAERLSLQLGLLNVATSPQQMDVPGFYLHPLKGSRQELWSIRVSANWRVTFRFEGEDAVLVNYEDYH
jgi:proteic killer suppression protein